MRWFKLISLITLASFALAASPAGGAPAEFRVLTSRTYQTMEGFGAGFNLIAQDLFTTIKNPDDQNRAYDLLFGNPAKPAYPPNLNIIRLTVSPLAKPTKAVSGARFDWVNDPGTTQELRALGPVFARTAPVLYAVPFTPPERFKIAEPNRLPKGMYIHPAEFKPYADYLADFLWYWKNVVGHEIAYISIQNEPGVAAVWAYCLWRPEDIEVFAPILADAIKARGLATKIIATEGTNWSGAMAHLQLALDDDASRGAIDVLASHSYHPDNDPARAGFANASAQYKKPVWMTEMSLMQPNQDDDPSIYAALKIAGYMRKDIVEANASAWIYCFAIFKTIPPGWTHQIGSMGVLAPSDGYAHGALNVPKRYWAMANFSRFVHKGDKRIDIAGPGENTVAFVSGDRKTFTIMAINPFAQPVMAHFSFPQNTIADVAAFVTSASEDLARHDVAGTTANGFTARVPPQSVVTYAGRLVP